MFVSESETAFLDFENRFLIICFCFIMIVFFRVCLFDLVYPIVCRCGVNTRSYLSFLIKQLCITNVCLLPRLSHDIRFRMMGAIKVFCFLNKLVLTGLVWLS